MYIERYSKVMDTKDSHISQQSHSCKASGEKLASVRTLVTRAKSNLHEINIYLLADVQGGGSDLADSEFKIYCQDTLFLFVLIICFAFLLSQAGSR